MMSANKQFNSARKCMSAVAVVAAMLAFAPSAALAADKDVHEDRSEMRVKDMHNKLKITAAQEAQWAKVAAVMRDDAKIMDKLTESRAAHAKEMTAVDDLKSYAEITDAHADGIKKLIPVFSDLYSNMSDVQKKEADSLFRHGDSGHRDRKMTTHK